MLMRFDPFRELDRVTQTAWGATPRPSVPMDAYRHQDDLVVHFDLPGVDADTIDLTVEKNVLTVTAERNLSRPEGAEILVAERPQGRFSRQLFLGESLDPDRITAGYDRGVLTLHIPIAEKAKPRKVEILSSDSRPVEVMSAAN